MAALKISVVVPVLNEEREIGDCIRAVRALPGDFEIIVADGGSSDATLAEARAAGADHIVQSPRGRGTQIRKGSDVTIGEALLFLHADARLPQDAARHVAETLADPRWSAGAFRVRHRRDGLTGPARWLIGIADLRSRCARIPYGDQAVFTLRRIYERIGGMPDQPLMEDIEFARRLLRLGPIRRVPVVVQVSGRRFQSRPLRSFLSWNTFPTLYRIGVSPERLARWYGASAGLSDTKS
ncbi:MAG: glycosyltransferase [Planctomycetota bacterium]|nr:MAG: glycosyltransferase [Planctomycetota bacterium]